MLKAINKNFLTALKPTEKRHRRMVIWKYQCICGNIVERAASWVKNGKYKSCGKCDQRYQKIIKLLEQGFTRKKIAHILQLNYFTVCKIIKKNNTYERNNTSS